jgi:hypothetical protein
MKWTEAKKRAIKLGPSLDFRANVKALENLEKTLASEVKESEPDPAKGDDVTTVPTTKKRWLRRGGRPLRFSRQRTAAKVLNVIIITRLAAPSIFVAPAYPSGSGGSEDRPGGERSEWVAGSAALVVVAGV